MKHKKILFIICLAFIPAAMYAQEFIIGAKYSIGNSIYKRQSDEQETEKYITHCYGMMLEFSPYFSKFFIVSGVELEMNNLGNNLMIPLALRIAFGKNFKVFIEGGGYYSIARKNKTEKFSFVNNFGAKAGLGMQYKIDKNWMAEMAYTGKFGLSPRLEEKIIIAGYQTQIEKYSAISHQLELAIKYRF
jgi:opacity protein-like surface antigen